MERTTILEELQKTKEQSNVAYVILSEDDIAKMMKKAAREGAKEGIAAYEKKQETIMAERTEKVRNSAKILIQHYRELKRMKDSSVYDPETITDITLSEILDNILAECRRDEFELSSTKRNMIITGMLLNHVDVQLENYRKECEQSKIPDIQRRYRIIKMMFLEEESLHLDEVAKKENIDNLTALFFGIEGLDVAEYRKKKRMEKQAKKKVACKNKYGAKKMQ